MTTIFEWDKDESASNFAKHGIDFVTAQKIWTDPFLLEIPARTTDEPRWLAIGKLSGRFWSAVFTRRNEVVRLISVRRSRVEEVDIYENTIES